jgi:hypothetical protein
MHDIEPYYSWLKYYNSSEDENSPYYGKEYNYDVYSETIYNYYIDPAWDYMGSETLYLKILYVDYLQEYIIIEFIGEWNDAINNDIMYLKRNIIDHFTYLGIKKFILIGENVYNFHGSDDCYYEEWFEDVEDGWIAALNFRDFIHEEWKKYNIDYYINFGGSLQISNWRTFSPASLYKKIDTAIHRRIDLT